MAIDWGAWVNPTGQGMRVGIEVTWEAVGHGEAVVTATVDYYTQNNFSWSDSQSLNLGGSIGGSISYSNSQGDGVTTKRGSRTYDYTYGSSSYGSSPGSRTFTASVSGAYNGITPSCSTSSNIPARPIAAPAPPTGAAMSTASNGDNKVTWVRHATSGEPYENQVMQRYTYGWGPVTGVEWADVSGAVQPGSNATSWTDQFTTLNRKNAYRVRAENSAGNSAWANAGIIYTKPDAPTSPSRTTSGSNQVLAWTNGVGYGEHNIEVWHAENGVYSLLTTLPGGATGYTHLAPNAATKHKYKFRAKTTDAVTTLYSDYSAETTETTGAFTTPSAPTNLSPASSVVVDESVSTTFTWKHNPTDGTAQTSYQLQHRVQGAGSWTTTAQITSGSSTHILAALTYGKDLTIEWQVKTWGGSATGSAFSASALYKTRATVGGAVATKYPVFMDIATGGLEADSATPMVYPGFINMYGGTVAPAGWILCQGQSLLRTDYPALFAAIGTNYGFADATHFYVPDLRVRVPIGAGTGKALISNDGVLEGSRNAAWAHSTALSGSITSSSTDHNHAGPADHPESFNTNNTGASTRVHAGGHGSTGMQVQNVTHTHPHTLTIAGVTHPYAVVNYIIKT